MLQHKGEEQLPRDMIRWSLVGKTKAQLHRDTPSTPLQEIPHTNGKATQEATDDRPASGKLVLHLKLEDVRWVADELVLARPRGVHC